MTDYDMEDSYHKTGQCNPAYCLFCVKERAEMFSRDEPKSGDEDILEDTDTCTACSGAGISGHDCGEDTCCCVDPLDNMICGVCAGYGFISTSSYPDDEPERCPEC